MCVTAGYTLSGGQALLINSAELRDAGIYVCIAQNNAGTAISQIRLEVQRNTVHYYMSKPFSSVCLSVRMINQKQMIAVFKLDTRNDLEIAYRWYTFWCQNVNVKYLYTDCDNVHTGYRVGQSKRGQVTFLLVTITIPHTPPLVPSFVSYSIYVFFTSPFEIAWRIFTVSRGLRTPSFRTVFE